MDISKPLPDGSVIVTIDGAELRAFPAEQMRELAKIRAERDSFAKQIVTLKDQVAALEAIKAIDEKITANQAAQIARDEQMMTAMSSLLLEMREVADGYKRAAKVGRIARTLNHPAWKVAVATIPVVVGLVAR